MKTLEEKIAVMHACLEGKKIEFKNYSTREWIEVTNPEFNWCFNDYRIKDVPLTKPQINWDHVNPEFKCMATDSDGHTYLFSETPRHDDSDAYWTLGGKPGMCVEADGFASFIPGTCEWNDSLVERPAKE